MSPTVVRTRPLHLVIQRAQLVFSQGTVSLTTIAQIKLLTHQCSLPALNPQTPVDDPAITLSKVVSLLFDHRGKEKTSFAQPEALVAQVNEVTRLNGELTRVNSELEQLRASIATLKSEKEEAEREWAEWQAACEDEREGSRRMVKAHIKDDDKLMERIEKAETQLQEKTESVSKLESELRDLRDYHTDREDLEWAVLHQRGLKEILMKKLGIETDADVDLGSNLERLQSQLHEERIAHDQLKTDHQNIRAQVAKHSEDEKKTADSHAQELRESRTKHSQATQDNKILQGKYEALDKAYVNLSREKGDWIEEKRGYEARLKTAAEQEQAPKAKGRPPPPKLSKRMRDEGEAELAELDGKYQTLRKRQRLTGSGAEYSNDDVRELMHKITALKDILGKPL